MENNYNNYISSREKKHERMDTLGIVETEPELKSVNNKNFLPNSYIINNEKINKDYEIETAKESRRSSSLPPSSLGDKEIEISKLKIEKLDLSLHFEYKTNKNLNLNKNEKDNASIIIESYNNRRSYIKNLVIIILITVLLLCFGLFIYGLIINFH